MSYPLHPKYEPKHAKNHRKKFFLKSFERDGFDSQAAYDLHHLGRAWAELVAADPTHPQFERAKAVLAVK